jgi:hypothetical protein
MPGVDNEHFPLTSGYALVYAGLPFGSEKKNASSHSRTFAHTFTFFFFSVYYFRHTWNMLFFSPIVW